MNGETQHGMQCAEFDALLTDALDGKLSTAQMAIFEQHKVACATCGTMFAEAEAGLGWLNELDEVEPPKNLVHNILAVTCGKTEAVRAEEVRKQPTWERVRTWVQPHIAPLFTPRFAMAMAMAFFSVTMVMNVAGVKMKDLRKIDLTPSGITKTYYESQARVVKYYENIRLVYEIESRVRDLKRAATTDSSDEQQQQKPVQKEAPKDEKQNNTNREPEQNQYQNYSRDKDDVVLVALVRRLSDPERQREEA
jgi:ribosomal protein L14E/L6E/L27E